MSNLHHYFKDYMEITFHFFKLRHLVRNNIVHAAIGKFGNHLLEIGSQF